MRAFISRLLIVSQLLASTQVFPAEASMESRAARTEMTDKGRDSESGFEGYSLKEEYTGLDRGSEYISGYYKGAVLMEVQLWGAVRKPGLHHTPLKIDLLTFLSLAGGPHSEARLDEVVISRRTGKQPEVFKLNVEHILAHPEEPAFYLQPNDTIVLEQRKSFFSADFLSAVSVLSVALSISLSAILLADHVK